MKIRLLLAALLIAMFAATTWAVAAYAPIMGIDWVHVYRPAALAMANGQSPYGVTDLPFVNPPWVLLPMLPIALLDPRIGVGVMFATNLFAFVYVMMRFRVHPLLVPVMIFATMNNLFNGNIDGLVALGFLLPPQIGLFFMLAKPQMGIAVAIFWLFQAWRQGGVKQVIKVFAPVIIALVASVLIYGFWMVTDITTIWWNASIWPWGIPVGLVLIVIAIWKQDIKWVVGASPFLAPYLTGHTWAFAILGAFVLLRSDQEVIYSKRELCEVAV